MRHTLTIGVLLTALAACQGPQAEQPAAAPVVAETTAAPTAPVPAAPDPTPAADTAQARQWLITSIEDNFKEENDGKNIDPDNPRSIYTRQYIEYKLDAIQLEYGGEEEDAAFHKKWDTRYQTQYVGTGSFLFSGQDYGTVKVTRCALKTRTKDNGLLFAVTTRDLTYKVDGKGDIKVIKTPDGYKIDDVLEY
ncbi:hypothetical protein [Hymenobacter metallicola]|uniref:DUF3828 domain-containing protein n=1 Tax=Hymenobacter metallicola TaxID=2563114 RepID=A0A4Z0QKV8_9BACT|nr:hypothetical protein [Hymenobacter metallicola]TGE29889.1 hypothetical protein E5K02_10645 [Hymenobacter metallicola]